MKKVKFTLDNESVQVEAGTTILEAAQSRGVFIPTFCHSKELKPSASCYVCVVEVEGKSDLIPSCSTYVTEGMVILTSTDRIDEARRTCVELLLSDHIGDCVGPCMSACPAGIDIPGFISLLALGEDRKSLELIKRNMPLPGVLGRVCKRPCEDACRRQLVDEQISICHLKRFAADAVSEAGSEYIPSRAPATGKTVAIIGAGPAGLTAAYYLQILGHECTVFDANGASGGMLRYGIPRFRLPADVIDREVAVIEKLGAELKYNVFLGQDFTLNELRADFDAVFLGLGAHKALSIRAPGEDAEGVVSGITFLREQNLATEKGLVGKKVIVIGGGDVAMDAARVSLRKGAGEAHIYCLEKSDDMPAGKGEIEEALAEGITIHNELGVKKIAEKDGAVVGVELVRCTSVFDEKGAFSPEYDDRDTSYDSSELLIVAVGQAVETGIAVGVGRSSAGLIEAHEHTFETNLKDVFAGGDCTSGPDSAVGAVDAGRRAAISIDQFVMGRKVVGEPFKYNHSMGSLEEVPEKVVDKFEKISRISIPSLDPKKRAATFDEVETGFSAEMVRAEARRCMECGCRDAHECRLRIYAAIFEADDGRFSGEKREYDLDDSHPEIVYESHKCIQCRTCVRITEELLGTSSMLIFGRGFSARVKPASGGKLNLVDDKGLIKIVENCPVGALTLKKDKVPTLDPVFRRPGAIC